MRRERLSALETRVTERKPERFGNVPSKFEVLASLEGELHLVLASGALETENDLLGGLGLLVENRLSLSSVTY